MLNIDLKGQTVRVNQSKIRKNPDNWHDVVTPGMHGRDDTVTVPTDGEFKHPTKMLTKKTSSKYFPVDTGWVRKR